MSKAGDDVETVITADDKITLRMLDGSVLDLLLSRRSISADQYAAGAQIYKDWYLAGFANSGVIDPTVEHVDGSSGTAMQDNQLDAAWRYESAIRALGKIHSLPIIDLVLLETTLVDYGRKRHNRASEKDAKIAAITSLYNALEALDIHYYGQRTARTRAAHEPDYRPKIKELE